MAASAISMACSPGEPTGNSSVPAGPGDGPVSTPAVAQGPEAEEGSSVTMSRTQISISSERGQVTAELVDNEATKALVRMLPLTISMRDHLRQEKTGVLPSPLPNGARQVEFSSGTLGLWGDEDFVIYYRSGRVPRPGIIVLGRVTGDLSIFDNAEPVTVRLQQTN
jgi:hypothetical protein